LGFLGDFTGSSARRDLSRGRDVSRRELTTGRDYALGDFAAAEGYFQPFARTGGASFDRWGALMGLGGPDARRTAQADLENDPIYRAMGDRAVRGISRNVAASGLTGAGYRAGSEALLTNYNSYLDRLLAGGGQGLQAAAGASGVRTRAGDTRFATGQQLAGLEQSYANAMAASRSTTMNNLLGIAGIGTQLYTGMNLNNLLGARTGGGAGGAVPGGFGTYHGGGGYY